MRSSFKIDGRNELFSLTAVRGEWLPLASLLIAYGLHTPPRRSRRRRLCATEKRLFQRVISEIRERLRLTLS